MKNGKGNVRLTAIVITINRNGIRRMITRTSRILDGILMKECPSKYLQIEREIGYRRSMQLRTIKDAYD